MIHQHKPSALDLELCCESVGDARDNLCMRLPSDPIHHRSEPRHYGAPQRLTVRVSDPDFMVHIADVAWTMEDGGAWYAAWVKPHNASAYRRLPNMDVWTRAELATYATKLISGELSVAALKAMNVDSI